MEDTRNKDMKIVNYKVGDSQNSINKGMIGQSEGLARLKKTKTFYIIQIAPLCFEQF